MRLPHKFSRRLPVIRKAYMAGVTLIEALVAFVILAVGLLGVIALQAESLKFNQQSFSGTEALILANDMAERMRANEEAYIDRSLAVPAPAPNFNMVPNYQAWQAEVARRLPGGVGVVDGDDAPNFLISITYEQVVLASEEEGQIEDLDPIDVDEASDPQTVEFTYVLPVRL